MSTLNDHLRNLLDELPGVTARDFIKAWNREQRIVCQERNWRDLRTQRQIQIGSWASGTGGPTTSGLPYSTGTVSGSAGGTTITSSGANFPSNWNGLNHMQIIIDSRDIYDVISINSVAETLVVWPALRTTYSGNTYQIVWVSGALLPSDMMNMRWVGKLSDFGRSEQRLSQPRDFVIDRVINGVPFLQMQNPLDSYSIVVHYYRTPTAITGMGDTVALPEYVQDLIYSRLLLYYLGRTPMEAATKGYMHAEVRDRIARARKAAISYDENQERDEGINESTIWTRSQSTTLR